LLIIHGTRLSKDRLGVVAELCPQCRDIRPAVVSKVSSYHHVYFVPVSKKKILRYDVLCSGCKQTMPVTAVQYNDYLREDPGDIGLLVETTNPDVVERLADRIALDERIAAGTATHSDRIRLINEVMTSAGSRAQRTLANVLWTTAVWIGAFICCMLAWAIASTFHPDPFTLYSLAAGVAVSLAFTIRSMATGRKRWVRKNVIPGMAADLAYLGPTVEELRSVATMAAATGLKLGFVLRKNKKFLEAIAQTGTAPPEKPIAAQR
jgi:hypothetical protein